MNYYRFNSRVLRKKSSSTAGGGSARRKMWISAGMLAFSAALFYFSVFHDRSGVVGIVLARILFRVFGKGGSYILPLWLALESIALWRDPDIKKWRVNFALSSVGFAILCGFFGLANFYVPSVPNYGGAVGKWMAELFMRLFGPIVGGILAAGIFIYILSVVKEFSLEALAVKIYEIIKRDLDEYKKVRALSKKLDEKQPRISRTPARKTAAGESAPAATPRTIIENGAVDSTASGSAASIADVKKSIPPAPAKSRDTGGVVTAAEGVAVEGAGVSSVNKIPKKNPPPEPQYVGYKIPPLDILSSPVYSAEEEKHHAHLDRARVLKSTLADFGINVEVGDIIPGPVVTRYDLNLEAGTKYQSITALSENLALALKASSIRIVPIPEKSAVGIEVPNPATRIVTIKEMASSEEFARSQSPLTFALGQTTDGAPYITDIIPMPHLLIAGATGSGKSVCIHSLILSILLKARPDRLKFILIDPKRLELPIYAGLPHLYDPSVPPENVGIITDARKAMATLKQLVYIMEKRYELFARHTVRNIESYNEKALADTTGELSPVHYIVVIIDELADLMLISRKEIEDDIQRLAQMARAVGIHLVLATQRPSVDVITGVIKANFSARIAFQTTSKVDSRVILDAIGAEDLLGRGDMLFLPPGAARPVRLQGTFVSTKDAETVVKYILAQGFKPSYTEYVKRGMSPLEIVDREKDEKQKEYIISALRLVLERRRISQDLLKAHFGSSARATDVLSLLEKEGFIVKPEGTNRWTIHFDKIQEYLAAETLLKDGGSSDAH